MFVSRALNFESGNCQTVWVRNRFRFRVDGVETFRCAGEIAPKKPKLKLERTFAELGPMPDDFMTEVRRYEVPQREDAL